MKVLEATPFSIESSFSSNKNYDNIKVYFKNGEIQTDNKEIKDEMIDVYIVRLPQPNKYNIDECQIYYDNNKIFYYALYNEESNPQEITQHRKIDNKLISEFLYILYEYLENTSVDDSEFEYKIVENSVEIYKKGELQPTTIGAWKNVDKSEDTRKHICDKILGITPSNELCK